MSRTRWLICALLFLATTVNYIDRQILALIKELLDKELGWTNEQFGLVNSAFQAAYARDADAGDDANVLVESERGAAEEGGGFV